MHIGSLNWLTWVLPCSHNYKPSRAHNMLVWAIPHACAKSVTQMSNVSWWLHIGVNYFHEWSFMLGSQSLVLSHPFHGFGHLGWSVCHKDLGHPRAYPMCNWALKGNPMNVGYSLLEAQIGQLKKKKKGRPMGILKKQEERPMAIGEMRRLHVLLYPLVPEEASHTFFESCSRFGDRSCKKTMPKECEKFVRQLSYKVLIGDMHTHLLKDEIMTTVELKRVATKVWWCLHEEVQVKFTPWHRKNVNTFRC